MPCSLLRRLSEAQLLVAVTAEEDLGKLQFLRDTGYKKPPSSARVRFMVGGAYGAWA